MSKQLAIASSFSVFAMACLMVLGSPDQPALANGDAYMPVKAELPSLDLPAPDLLP